jgi:acetolactate synthase-1/2/3 large subunit
VSTHSTARYFLEGLNELGIEYIFCNLGTDHAPVIEEMARFSSEQRPYPKPISCPHENVAIHMAGGYALATGQGQVVMVHVDVGTANTANGVHNLFRSRIPVLLLAGKAPYTIHGETRGGRDTYVHFIQEPYDMASIVRPFTKWEYNLPSGLVVKEALRRAHSVMHSDPKGPVYMTVQREILMEPFESSRICSFPGEKYGPTCAGGVDEETVFAIAEKLMSARNPVLMTAYAGRNPACPAVIQELAETLGIRVYEFNGISLNISHASPCFMGLLPDKDLPDADLGLMIDVDVPFIPANVRPNPNTCWVHIDVDTVKKDLPMWGFPSHVRVQADSYKALKRLLEVVKQRISPELRNQVQQRMERIKADKAALDDRLRRLAENKGKPGEISPAYLCAELNKVIGADDVVVNEAIRNAPVVAMQICRTRPGSYVSFGGGGLGMGGGTALGIKLAKPKANVFHITGDGSFYFSNPSAVYAVSKRYQLPIFTVVLDNSGWQAVKEATLRVFPEGAAKELNQFHAVLTEGAQLHKVGEAFGAYGETIENPDEVPAAIARCLNALGNGQPALLVARIPGLR